MIDRQGFAWFDEETCREPALVRRRAAFCVLLLASCGGPAGAPPSPERGLAAAAGTEEIALDRPTAADAMVALQASRISMERWRFCTDPGERGETVGFHEASFDDSAWPTIEIGRPWEAQGYEDYDGVAWYRAAVEVPAEWAGAEIRLQVSGADDVYGVWVNGVHLGAVGDRVERSVDNRHTWTRLDRHLRTGERNLIALRVTDRNGPGGITQEVRLQRVLPIDRWAWLLPDPVIDGAPRWRRLYWAAWQMAFDKLSFGTSANRFAEVYMDEGFSPHIYQWDSSFIALFARYGGRLFPSMAALDNFYGRQRDDGYIQRGYSQVDGSDAGEPSREQPRVNPPLFAWAELEYVRFTGDLSRLPRVLPRLASYYRWLREHLVSDLVPDLYFQTQLGSGMDNTPRGDSAFGGWIDMSSQQALAAECLAELFTRVGDAREAAFFERERAILRRRINESLWDAERGWYFDARADVMHAGAFWTLVAGIPDAAQLARVVAHLRDPDEFHRAHLFPSLAASADGYSPRGHYWRGGVWSPTNYAAVRGLSRYGEHALAREVVTSHLDALAAVFESPPTDEARIADEERDGVYSTLWECYSPDALEPATRWDDTSLSRQDFVGWTGLGPIAMLLETAIGIEVDGAARTLTWRLERGDRHGVQRMPVGGETVDAVVDAGSGPRQIHVRATGPITLIIVREGHARQRHSAPAGESSFALRE